MLADYNATSELAVQSSTSQTCGFTQMQTSYPLTLKQTFDCGVQANLDYPINPQTDIAGLDDLMAKKRQKRKQYKKRKKQQKKIMQRENKDQFKQIIDLFYQRQAKFIDYSDRLEQLVCSFNQNQFKNIFDAILKQRVVIVRNSIWEYTQAILQQNPLQMRHDHPFYLDMVDQIFRYYKLIQKSSQQAQQVIYIYLTLNAKDTDQPITPQDLGRRTFRYLIQTDQTLRKLIHMCDRKISYVRCQQRQKLQILISKLKNFRERFQNNFEDDQDPNDDYYDTQGDSDEEFYQDQQSTAISQTTQEFEEHSAIKKKKNKRSTMDSDQEKLYYYFQNLTFDHKNRLQCRVNEDQVQDKTQKYLKSLAKSFKKPTQFEVLRKKLQTMQPCRKIYQQFKRNF